MRALVLACSFALLAPAVAVAQNVVFAVRHAERADTGTAPPNMAAADPDLSPAGRERAKSLALMLKDAKITAIFTSEFKRTIQTATPLARALNIEIKEVPTNSPNALTKLVLAAKGNVLVVGHSNTVPPLLTALGIKEKVAIGEQEFDNLFVVIRSAQPRLVRMHYR
jgi:broad specificity phosphatase PhoE